MISKSGRNAVPAGTDYVAYIDGEVTVNAVKR
jgi:hypothetical protein